MTRYLFQAADTSEARATQARHSQNRVEVIRPVFECLGGRLEWVYYAFGEYDVVVTAEMPDNVSATAIALATTASGAFKICMTTLLMTIEEGLEAMRKASGTGYRSPGHSRFADGSGLSKKPSPQ